MELLKGISEIMTTAAQGGTPDSYTLASAELAKRRHSARETLKELTAGDMRAMTLSCAQRAASLGLARMR